MMRAAVLETVGKIAIVERAVPAPGPVEVLIEVSAVGVCGSDVHYFEHGRIGDYVVDQPLVLGHEASGVVVGLGSGARRHHVGQRVSLEPGCRTSLASSAGPAGTTCARTCGSSPRPRSTERSANT